MSRRDIPGAALVLERQFSAELDGAAELSDAIHAGAAAHRALNDSEIRVGSAAHLPYRSGARIVGIAECRCVADVVSLGAEFHLESLADLEVLEQGEIQPEHARAAENVAAGSAEHSGAARLRETGGA